MIDVNKKMIYEDFTNKYTKIKSDKSINKVIIKDMIINNEQDIKNGIDKCIHDKYSDIDIILKLYNNKLKLKLNDIGIKKDNILGIKLEKNDDSYVIRIVQKDGIRYDIVLFNAHIQEIENEINEINKSEIFIAILSLVKLMRNDYLISAHLSHMLCMNSLVEQMIDRDIEYNTNFHRYGYKENLDYYNTYINIKNKYCNSEDETYNHISKLLISGIENVKNISNEDKKIFYDIWDFYINKRLN